MLKVTTIKSLRGALDSGAILRRELVGKLVKIGFLTLSVSGYEETPGDYLPNKWHLEALSGQKYTFTPYHGLEKA